MIPLMPESAKPDVVAPGRRRRWPWIVLAAIVVLLVPVAVIAVPILTHQDQGSSNQQPTGEEWPLVAVATGDVGRERSITVTDAEGRYAFRTIRPVPYGGRPPHLHFKLAHARAGPLTTQLYPRGESAERSGGFGLSGRTARSRLEFAPVPATGREPGALAATYDFVLRTS